MKKKKKKAKRKANAQQWNVKITNATPKELVVRRVLFKLMRNLRNNFDKCPGLADILIGKDKTLRTVIDEYLPQPRLSQPGEGGGKATVVIEVNGGVVQSVYLSQPMDVVLLDWDNINEGDEPGFYPYHTLAEMPDETREQYERALLETAEPGEL